MTKQLKTITSILILNVIALSAALVFVTFKKLTFKPAVDSKPEAPAIQGNRPESNYKIPQWKLIGKLDNPDLSYDFRNGLGGELNVGSEGQLLDGESIWIYSNKLREILTEANKTDKKYPAGDEHTLGYIAIVNRVSKTKINTPELWKAFPVAIGDHRLNLVKPSNIDLLKNDQANQLFYNARKEADAFFRSIETDKTAKKD